MTAVLKIFNNTKYISEYPASLLADSYPTFPACVSGFVCRSFTTLVVEFLFPPILLTNAEKLGGRLVDWLPVQSRFDVIESNFRAPHAVLCRQHFGRGDGRKDGEIESCDGEIKHLQRGEKKEKKKRKKEKENERCSASIKCSNEKEGTFFCPPPPASPSPHTHTQTHHRPLAPECE